MLLRPRQITFVERSLAALREHSNTLGVAATGFGKTIALSSVTGHWLENSDAKACVLSHREEIHKQNAKKFLKVNPQCTISQFDVDKKAWDGQATFAMVQTLGQKKHIDNMPTLDLLVIDEAHHCVAPSYRRIVDGVREKNPDVAVYGVTATASRGDKKGLREVFDNVADQVRIGELIKSGHLVPPITFGIDLGVNNELDRLDNQDDMDAVASIMDHRVINDAVVKHWKEKSGDRKTIVFCSTVPHAHNACEAFQKAGINAAVISGDMPKHERSRLLKEFDRGDLQVLLNCFVLTEGYDSQPVSCIVLLRPSSQKSTFIQCVGRGLRTVDPTEYPGVIKKDCIVLDFGTSAHTHGSLEQDVDLEGPSIQPASKENLCPSCSAQLPVGVSECPLCGAFTDLCGGGSSMPTPGKEEKVLKDFVMSEIDLLAKSSFQWTDLHGDGGAYLATGFNAWSGNFFLDDQWYAVGGKQKSAAKFLAAGDRSVCFAAADDWLNLYETDDGARKSKRWLKQTATSAQLKYIPEHKNHFGLTRYHASCLLAFKFNKHFIQKTIFSASHQKAKVA
ncbi:MAG: DEAD/DEAH box helicase [Agarilytica sp.]